MRKIVQINNIELGESMRILAWNLTNQIVSFWIYQDLRMDKKAVWRYVHICLASGLKDRAFK